MSRAALSVLRLWDEFLFVLRREGLLFSTAQAETALGALTLVGYDDPWVVRETLAAVLVRSPRERARFDECFRQHFRPGVRGKTLWERLEALGLSVTERSTIADWLRTHDAASDDALVVWLEGAAARDDWLARSRALRALEGERDLSRVGFLVHQVMSEAKLPAAEAQLAALDLYLRDALGRERAAEVAALVRAELAREAQRMKRLLRDRVEADQQQNAQLLERAELPRLDPHEIELAERAVRALAERLTGRARLLERRGRRGRIDLRATRQKSKANFGVPIQLVRKQKRRHPSTLLVLCDVSESVRAAARYLLLFLYHAQKVWKQTRTFVFVSDVAETTEAFRLEGAERALALAYGGSMVATSHNSNYGRALATFEAHLQDVLDRNTSVIVLGDGRSNYLEPGIEVLERITRRARATVWLCPEPESAWGRGESRMLDYARVVIHALPVDTLEALERAMATLPKL